MNILRKYGSKWSHDFPLMSAITCNSNEFFISHEMEEGMGQSMDLTIGVQNVLARMWVTLELFKSFTNFVFFQ
jgi:hypothetical protein